MKMKSILLGVAAAVGFASAAQASFTFDPSTGAGFSGKGDVQVVLNLNNAALQNQAAGLSFRYHQSSSYDVTKTWEVEVQEWTGEYETVCANGEITCKKMVTRKVYETVTEYKSINQNAVSNVNAGVEYDAKTKKQVVGFNLRGFGSIVVTGDPIPQVGDSCANGGPDSNCHVSSVVASPDNQPGTVKVNGVVLPVTPPAVF
jgi:hypothetical protein